MSAALTFRGYGFKYAAGDKAALSDVDLSLRRGAVTSVIAPQGAGKTTLLRAAAGLLGEIYQGEVVGEVSFDSSASQAHARQSAAFFDGYVQVTLAVETVAEEIGLPLYAAGMSRADRTRRVHSVARELRIEHLLDRSVTQLSGGEEKLVGIACAFAPVVPVHVLDEPFEQLDVAHIAAVIRAAKRRARAGALVMVATGATDVALNIADNAVIFDSRWSAIEAPDLAMLAATSQPLGESPVMSFLRRHHAATSGVRRFRDAVRRVS